MSPLNILLLLVSLAVSFAPFLFEWFPKDFSSLATYFYAGLTLLPTLMAWASIQLDRNGKWFRRICLFIWALALVSLIYALAISNSDAWAPVVWIAFSQVWFGVSMLMLFFSAVIHFIRQRKRVPTQIRQTHS
jgi:predicted membrane channel-forming protein YqfA (hemolysin III family)